MARDRVTVQEAARRLGVKDDAIRKRIQRGTLEHDKGPDGRVYVYLEPSSVVSRDKRSGNKVHDAAQDMSYDAFLVSLQDEVRYLRSVLQEEREARRRADTIIAQLTQANAALAQLVPGLQASQRQRETARALWRARQGCSSRTTQAILLALCGPGIPQSSLCAGR